MMACFTVKNLATDIFSFSSTSASARIFKADGPQGKSIIENQRMGSSLRKLVLEATNQMAVMLMLWVAALMDSSLE